ncbi:DUF2911 domain-containing protein [Mongoliitalea daihaiensis]|uniref:DUF2911 domain-containing protein n=1 Tax=Mongoliitalea daihaiensis TaxID=2782006 RepID=UPI001F24A8D5|nr:DUF2911 domain-containing protein [Mongoliitalea daihaiensis]UJP63372.1 DUF2911 domain-containing protein [Mongoliitalea daihaiensis]
MKKINLFLTICFVSSSMLLFSCGSEKSAETSETEESSQTEVKATEQRASPLRTIEGSVGSAQATIQYGAPSVKGRVIWGDLVPYNEVWRTGANESTYIDINKDVIVEGETLAAGRYSIFTIPKASGKWTVIFNSEWDLEHGHFQYKEVNDVLRVESSPEWQEESQEQLSIAIESPGIIVRWERLVLPIVIQ